MLKKCTFYSDGELNKFFKDNTNDAGETVIYLVKLIITYNQVTKLMEQHLIYSYQPEMKGGMHMRKGRC